MLARRRRLTRRDFDRRLGYTGLGVGAVAFVLVLVGSLIVIEVAPRVDPPGPFAARGQSVVRYPALEAVPSVDRVARASGAGPAERGRPARSSAETDTVTPAPDESGGPGTGGSGGNPDGGSTPDDPGAPTVEGPLSQAVDPVVDRLTGALDGTTGGATSPVTGPAGGLVDDVTDLGDGLLPRP